MYGPLSFLGAFLLFFLQPLVGKRILPLYGGGAQVWVTCMLFFQLMLLAGYAYAHLLLARIEGRRRQALLHAAVLSLGAAQLLLNRLGTGSPPGLPGLEAGSGSLSVLWCLLRISGFPLLALGATAPLLQKWFSDEAPERSPYRLYAASNLGSLIGLLVFPFGTERWFPTSAQVYGLLVGYTLFAFAMAWKGFRIFEMKTPHAPDSDTAPAPDPVTRLLWVFASAVGVMLLMSTTSFLTQEIAPVPLLWVAPLVAYLVTFILIFEGRYGSRWGLNLGWSTLFGVFLILLASLKTPMEGRTVTIVASVAGLFLACLGVHGYLFSLRPGTRHLTRFYLLVSFGGVLGGIYTALLAPMLFERAYELGQAYAFAAFIALFWVASNPVRLWKWAMPLTALVAGGGLLMVEARKPGMFYRDLYGILSVRQEEQFVSLWHGRTLHGLVDVQNPGRPLAYYAPSSGAGRAMRLQRSRKGSLHVGVLGLGVGSMAAYGRQGDSFTFYEICPRVAELAGPVNPLVFTLLKTNPASMRLVMGDGRSSLELARRRGAREGFDLLVVDAFSGDSIPWHLLTVEALQLYLDHLAADGILAVHLSNRLPIHKVGVANIKSMGLNGLLVIDPAAYPTFQSVYLLVFKDPSLMQSEVIHQDPRKPGRDTPRPSPVVQTKAAPTFRPWRDDWCAVSDLLFD